MKGFINLYVNFEKFDSDQIDLIFQIIKRDNKEVFEACAKNGFPIMLHPTQDEGSRMEKLNFNQPYPRFLNKNNNVEFYSSEIEEAEDLEEVEPKVEQDKE